MMNECESARRVLFLDTDFDSFGDYFRRRRSESNVSSCKLYSNCPLFVKKVMLFLGKHVSPMFQYWIYGDWKNHIREYDLVILPSRLSVKFAVSLIKRNNVKQIVYYWNLITDREIQPDYLNKNGVLCCTFDEGDSERYNIPFVGTYFFNQKALENRNEKPVIFYVGIARPGRIEIIKQLETHLKDICVFNSHVVEIGSTKGRLSYEETIDQIQKADIILDLTREEQRGLTLRPLEALFFEKKLITNNRFIKNYDFYRPENIFILDENNWDELPDFLAGNYSPVEDEIKSKYTFDSWLKKVIDYVQ